MTQNVSDLLAVSKAEQDARARLANNGRNPANKNAGIRVGGDLHLCEMLLAELDAARARLAALSAPEGEWQNIETAPRNATEIEVRIPKAGYPGHYRQIVHWADGGGDEQPRFRGWFRDTGYGFAEIGGEPDAWRPAAPLVAEPRE